MKNVALFLIVAFTLCNNSHCQLGSIFKYGNVVYYRIDSLSNENLKGTSILFDNKIEDRYFDIYLKGNSIQVFYKDTSYFFNQEKRSEPKNYHEIILYKNRYLTYDNFVIKSLKLKNIDQKFIIADAKIINKNYSTGRKSNDEILLSLDEVDGIFLGSGKNSRAIIYGVGILGGIFTAIMIFN